MQKDIIYCDVIGLHCDLHVSVGAIDIGSILSQG